MQREREREGDRGGDRQRAGDRETEKDRYREKEVENWSEYPSSTLSICIIGYCNQG